MLVSCVRAVYLVFSFLCCGILFAMAVVAGLIFALGDKYRPNYHVEFFSERSVLGEGPYWDEVQQRLYWVDMKSMLINSYDPATQAHFQARVVSDKEPVSLVIRVEDTEDKFVVALKGTLAFVQWDGVSNVNVIPVEFLDIVDQNSSARCNDGKVDPSNRLWVGTMGAQIKSDPKGNEFEKDKGEMYRIDFEGNKAKKTKILEKMQIPNGLDWSTKKDRFYLVDSLTFKVTEYEYDDNKGTIKFLKEVYDLKAHGIVGTPDKPNSLPDGMTIDDEGLLWIAVYGTGKLIRIDPNTGEKVFETQIRKMLQPTSVVFGGRGLEDLFVTSAHVDWTEEFEQKYPQSGKLFKLSNLEVKGARASLPVRVPKDLLDEAFKTRENGTKDQR